MAGLETAPIAAAGAVLFAVLQFSPTNTLLSGEVLSTAAELGSSADATLLAAPLGLLAVP